jgi:hypothetical protein
MMWTCRCWRNSSVAQVSKKRRNLKAAERTKFIILSLSWGFVEINAFYFFYSEFKSYELIPLWKSRS